jgi:hypothetical protein
MKFITSLVAALVLFCVCSASADTFDFTWESTVWTKTYESPTQAVVSGPFTLSGHGTATFVDRGTAGETLQFDGSNGGTLIASGDGTLNGPMKFRTADNSSRNGLGVLVPTADGFTVAVHRAASGPDAGATFFGTAKRVTVSAPEPASLLLPAVALAGAAWLTSRRRRV